MNTATQCNTVEDYAYIIMNARQKGVEKGDLTSLASVAPQAFKNSIDQMIDTA